MTIYDIIGLMGIAMNLFGFFLIQNGNLSPTDGRYTIMQCSSCVLLLISLSSAFNFASVLLNCIVIVITLYGFVRARRSPAP
jgi:predicted membrane protein